MAFDSKGLDSYVDVAQRIADFRECYPSGCLQPLNPAQPFEVRKIDGTAKDGKDFTATFIVYTAAAYRTPDDQRPGIGVAWEVFPGRTTFTLGSELMNAETSAWGRAIIAVLASDSKRGVASREEVRNRAAERDGNGAESDSAAEDVPRNQDGSISRSRATREQLDAAGIMTDEQRREHNALRRGADGKLPADEHAKLRRCSPGNPCREADCPHCTPGADAWADQPAGPPLRMPKEAQSLPSQIGMHFSRLGVTDRDVRLGLTAQIAGTGRLGSSNELKASEAKRVLEVLSKCRDRAALREYIDSNQEVSAGV